MLVSPARSVFQAPAGFPGVTALYAPIYAIQAYKGGYPDDLCIEKATPYGLAPSRVHCQFPHLELSSRQEYAGVSRGCVGRQWRSGGCLIQESDDRHSQY